jgi:hypothetical protein
MTQANLSALVGMQPMHKAMISFIEIWKKDRIQSVEG